jgi:hypothetical protein
MNYAVNNERRFNDGHKLYKRAYGEKALRGLSGNVGTVRMVIFLFRTSSSNALNVVAFKTCVVTAFCNPNQGLLHMPSRRVLCKGLTFSLLFAIFFFVYGYLTSTTRTNHTMQRHWPAQIILPIPESTSILVRTLNAVAQVAVNTAVSSNGPLNASFLSSFPDGAPGTRISGRVAFMELQQFLGCSMEEGSYSLEEQARSFTRNPHHLLPTYMWRSSSRCHDSLYPVKAQTAPINASNAGQIICSRLKGRTMILLGDHVQYTLHNLLLNSLHHAHTDCPGAQYCNWHTICATDKSDTSLSRKMPAPHVHPGFGVLRFVWSTTLYSSTNPYEPRFNYPYVSPATGVREMETSWYPWTRLSDLIILSKGPISAPAKSYASRGATGTFYLGKSSGTSGRYTRLFEHLIPERVPPSHRKVAAGVHEILNAAVRATFSHWLPSLLSTLVLLRSEPNTKQKLIVWRGEWFVQPGCDLSPDIRKLSWESLIGWESAKATVTDPWSLFHNSQGLIILSSPETNFTLNTVYLQSRILQLLLPHFGIFYLPHEMHLAPFRAGFARSAGDVTPDGKSGKKWDCMKYQFPSPGLAIEDAFLSGLAYILATV